MLAEAFGARLGTAFFTLAAAAGGTGIASLCSVRAWARSSTWHICSLMLQLEAWLKLRGANLQAHPDAVVPNDGPDVPWTAGFVGPKDDSAVATVVIRPM